MQRPNSTDPRGGNRFPWAPVSFLSGQTVYGFPGGYGGRDNTVIKRDYAWAMRN